MRELIMIFFISCSFFVYANSEITGSVSGIVVDYATKEKIEYVSITLKKEATIVSGTLTNKKGYFKISEIPMGLYTLEISFMGFKSQVKKIHISKVKRKHSFSRIYLKEDINQLEAVEIRAETTSIIQKVDKKVIVVGKDLLASGSTASEILDNLPSVSVESDGTVSYRGNANVMIYLDGKPTSISNENLLDQLPANTIKNIELISNPSARYNPEGIGGIINIVLNKNVNSGFNGNLVSGITFRKEPSTNTSLNLNFKKGKINIFGNFGYSDKKINRDGFFNHYFNNTFNQYDSRNIKLSKLIKLGIDFRLNKKNTISVYTHQNYLDIRKKYNSVIQENADIFNLDINNYFDNKVQIYNINYKVEFNKPSHNLEFEINFDNNSIEQNDNSQDDFHNSTLTNYTDKINIDRNFTILNLDYVNTFAKDISLELGVESRIRKADNKKTTNQLNLAPNSFFEYDRDEYSFYATVSKKINDKFSYKLGSRIEYFKTKSFLDNASVYKKDYTTWYPSVHLTYKKNKKNKFQLGYSKHIFRPGINEVNPTNLWNSYVMTFVGNPKLVPSFVDYFEFNYTHKLKKGALSFVPFYQITRNSIFQNLIQDVNNPDKLILSYDNADVAYSYALEAYFYYKISKYWFLNFGSLYYTEDKTGLVNNEVRTIKAGYFTATLSQSFTITKKLKISVLGKYYGVKKSFQFDKEDKAKVDIASRYRFLKNKASFSLKFTDIFNTMDQRFSSENPYRLKGKTTLDSQSVYFGFSYNFGSSKIKNRNRKKHEKQEINDNGAF